jgi:hypothetical protein
VQDIERCIRMDRIQLDQIRVDNRRTNLMVEAENAAKAAEKARPNREEAAKAIRYLLIMDTAHGP